MAIKMILEKGCTKIFVALCFFYAIVPALYAQTQSPKKVQPATTSSMSNSPPPREPKKFKQYTERQVRQMKFKYNSKNPMPLSEVTKIPGKIERCRNCDPHAGVLLYSGDRSKSWYASKVQSNGEVVEKHMRRKQGFSFSETKNDKRVRETSDPEESERRAKRRERNTQANRMRMAEAKSGSKDDPMMLRDRKGKIVQDPRGRTKGEYLQHKRLIGEAYEQRKAQEKQASKSANVKGKEKLDVRNSPSISPL